jgi:hypothetical protein
LLSFKAILHSKRKRFLEKETHVSIEQIVAQLDIEIARLTHVRNLLKGEEVSTGRRRGRPPVSGEAARKPGRPRKGGITPAGRKRLSEMMKARWAARRKQQGKK